MENNLNQNNCSKLALPMGSVRVPKFLYIILIILGFLVLIVGGMYFYFENSKKSKASKMQITDQATNKLSNLEVAKKALDWLDTQKNNQGIYAFSCKCDDNDCTKCTISGYSQREGSFMVWGRYKYYEKTNDSTQLEKIKEELDTLSKLPLQFEDWNCRNLLDLWESKTLDDKTKEAVADVCQNDGRTGSFYFGDSTSDQDNKVLKDIPDNIEKITLKEPLEIDPVYNKEILKSEFEQNVFFTSEDVAKNIVLANRIDNVNVLKGDPEKSFKFALYGYDLLKDSLSYYQISILGIASLDMYKATNEEMYLDLALFLEGQNETVNSQKLGPDSMIYSALFLERLNKIINNKSYLIKSQKITDSLIDEMFDNVGYFGFKSGLGGFIDPKKDFFSAKQNGLIVGVILNE